MQYTKYKLLKNRAEEELTGDKPLLFCTTPNSIVVLLTLMMLEKVVTMGR